MTSPYAVKIPVTNADDKPVPKTYYQVLLKYNLEAPENKDITSNQASMESPPLETEKKAEDVLKAVCKDITDKIAGAEVVRIPPKERIDDYSVVVIRERKTKDDPVLILARLGIIKVDYSKESIH